MQLSSAYYGVKHPLIWCFLCVNIILFDAKHCSHSPNNTQQFLGATESSPLCLYPPLQGDRHRGDRGFRRGQACASSAFSLFISLFSIIVLFCLVCTFFPYAMQRYKKSKTNASYIGTIIGTIQEVQVLIINWL